MDFAGPVPDPYLPALYWRLCFTPVSKTCDAIPDLADPGWLLNLSCFVNMVTGIKFFAPGAGPGVGRG